MSSLILEIDITRDMLIESLHWNFIWKQKPLNHKDEIENFYKTKTIGKLGQLLYTKTFPHIYEKETYQYDLISKKTGAKLEVKSKEICVIPKNDYRVNVNFTNDKQDCDYYVFAMIHNSLKVGYILGYKEKNQFFKESTKYSKGEKDPINGWVYRYDVHCLQIDKLNRHWG